MQNRCQTLPKWLLSMRSVLQEGGNDTGEGIAWTGSWEEAEGSGGDAQEGRESLHKTQEEETGRRCYEALNQRPQESDAPVGTQWAWRCCRAQEGGSRSSRRGSLFAACG